MSFVQIVREINNQIAEGEYALSNFQQYRAQIRGRGIANYRFLNYHEDFVKNENYTYHIGGSNETQFNVSYEGYHNKTDVFRYGLAFSLESSQSTPDPIGSRRESIERFNEFVKKNKEYFDGFKQWSFFKGKRSSTEDVHTIKKNTIELGRFIFIGKIIAKKPTDITNSDIEEIISTLDYLYPLYKHLQFNEPFSTEERFARLTWNTNKWYSPIYHPWDKKYQGRTDKLHEQKHGYGGEEWLFNPRYEKDGYQYGFIQGIDMMTAQHGFLKQLTLFTIEPTTKKRLVVAKIDSVEIISDAEQILKDINPLFDSFKKTMSNELEEIGVDYKHFNKVGLIPNVRFKNINATIYEDPIEVDFLRSQKFTRFNAYMVSNHTELQETQEILEIPDKFTPGEGRTSKGHTRTTKGGTKDVQKNHSRITDALRDYLIEQWGLDLDKNLSIEKTRIDGGLIDAIARIDDEYITFEVKTRNSAKGNIRESLGQLLEYSFYKKNWPIKRMVIIGPAEPKTTDLDYLVVLNHEIKTPIEYWSYDNSKKLLKEKFKLYK